jgi:hypothetical protein
MTDERSSQYPGTRPDDDEATDDAREAVDRDPRPATDTDESNPLLREGADAPDAADIEDPDEQL